MVYAIDNAFNQRCISQFYVCLNDDNTYVHEGCLTNVHVSMESDQDSLGSRFIFASLM